MKREREKDKYLAGEYESDELRLKIEKGVSLRVNLKDDLEVGILLAKFRQAGLGSSRELGKLFKRSASTVINKGRLSQEGSKRLVDGRKQKKRYKIEEVKVEVLLIWIKNPMAEDKDILDKLKPRLSALGVKLDLKSLKRYIEDSGIKEVRSRLRTEEFLEKKEGGIDSNNGHSQDKPAIVVDDNGKGEEIIHGYSRYAGQMLHVPQLYQMNFPQMVKGLPGPAREDCIYSIEQVGHLLYFLYASGGKRLYDLDSVDHRGFGALIGEEDNLRSSGMNKRVGRMATPEAVEEFQKESLVGRVRFINREDLKLAYCDTHVIEVWVDKFIPMARHGTKNKQVKAINVHYLIGSDTGTPLAKEYSAGNKRLHWAIPQLVKRADEGLKGWGWKVGTICYDKGGFSLKAVKELIKTGKGFLCWGRRVGYVKKQIEKVRAHRFRYRHKKGIRQDGKIIEVEERIADTTTHLKGMGKLRTIVVELPEVEGGERLCIYTNLKRKIHGPIELREMMRYKQRQENFFKFRKSKTALDCFVGGRCRIKQLSRPSKKLLELLRKQQRRLTKKIEGDNERLSDTKELRSHGLCKADTAARESEYLNRRIRQNIEQKEKTEEKIQWAEGGKRPEFIKQRYELELEKQKLLNEFQDLAFLSKRETLKEFISCYQKVLEKEALFCEEISQRMKNLDKAAIENELFRLGGIITCDKRENRMTIMIVPQGREYFRKALEIFLHQQNKKKVVIQYSSKEKYQLYFCLAPPPLISAN